MIRRFTSWYALLSWLWLAIILSLATYSAHTLFVQGKIQFDVLALLPEGKTADMKAVSQLMEDANLSGRLLILVGSPDAKTAKLALQHFRRSVVTDGLPIKEQNALLIAQDYKKLFTDLYPYRAGLISKADQQQLKNGQEEALAKRALAEVMLPFSSFRSGQVDSDPFSLYPQFVTSFLPQTAIQRDMEGELFTVAEGDTWYLYQAQITEPVFSLKLQEQLISKLSHILSDGEMKNVKILKTGALFYAAAGAKQAQHEISKIGLISTGGIILMMLLVFRTARPILLAIAVVASGLTGGLAACLYFFGSIHILSLVFGCSLIGVAVDYALYYFCASYVADVGRGRLAVLASLMPALPLAVLASSMGYGLLMVAPFPGVQQMAVLACVGLLCTFLSVCLWGPYFILPASDAKNATYIRARNIQNYLEKFAAWGQKKYCRLILVIVLLAIFGAGAVGLTFEDNVRSFQSLDAGLKAQEDRIKSMTQVDNSVKFLAVTAANLEEVLQKEESLIDDLDHLRVNYRATAELIPSQKRQQENRSLVDSQLYKKHYNTFMQALGIEKTFNAQNLGLSQPLLILDQAGMKNLPTGWRELVHYGDNGIVTGRMILNNPPAGNSQQFQEVNEQIFESIAAKYPGVSFIDPVREYSKLFASYREVVMTLVFAVLLGFSLLLALSKGIQAAVSIVTPVLLSILASIGIISLLGTFTLFHAMGFMLVLCIGIDYALFLYWRGSSQEGNLRLLGNGLAATTTILSFGLLALSQTTAVHSFGLSVFLGIVLCFLVTTLFLGKYERKH